MSFRRYLIHLFTYIGLFIGCVAVFNLIIDPYAIFNLVKIEGFNSLKPELNTHARMIKAHQVRTIRPDSIILGSSRAETGLDPEHPGWSPGTLRHYNLALHSANIYEVYKYLQHAHAVQAIKQAVIGLDFFMFNMNKQVEKDFDQSRLEPSEHFSSGWYQDIFNALFTLDALRASINTLLHQHDPSVVRYKQNGFPEDSGKWQAIRLKGGHHQAALNNERYTLVSEDSFPFFTLVDPDNPEKSTTINTFRKIIRFAKSNGIDLRLFISPMHARKLVLLHEIGLWREFGQWKRSLVQVLQEEAPDMKLWDFTGFNSITTEPFPPLGDTNTQMRWYWESSHYKKEAGKLILDIVLERLDETFPYPDDFGVILAPDTIDSRLEHLSRQLKEYRENHPENLMEVRKMIKETRKKREALQAAHRNLQPQRKF